MWNESTALSEFSSNYKGTIHVDFPAIHQFQQKSLLQFIQNDNFVKIVDPETLRFAYDTYSERVGLTKLPYCPPNFNVITPAFLNSYQKQKDYVKLVLDEEYKLGANILVSPYHYTHNTNALPTYKNNPVEQWFDLDIKLLKEAIDYKNSVPKYSSLKLYGGICINSNGLIDEGYKADLLNYYTAHECDGYIVYADGIDKQSNPITIYHYIDTLLKLQNNTQRPVIAGRSSALVGLGLISLSLAGFSSGSARFESFSEELHKDSGSAFNLHERYYFPGLLSTIPIDRNNPTRLTLISNVLGPCKCIYCQGKKPEDVIKAANNKLHYLQNIHEEIDSIKTFTDKKKLFYQ